MSQKPIETTPLGQSLKGLRVSEETYYEELLEEANTTIKFLQEKVSKLQKICSFWRGLLILQSYSVKYIDGEYEIASKVAREIQIKRFPNLEDGIEWAERRFLDTYKDIEEN